MMVEWVVMATFRGKSLSGRVKFLSSRNYLVCGKSTPKKPIETRFNDFKTFDNFKEAYKYAESHKNEKYTVTVVPSNNKELIKLNKQDYILAWKYCLLLQNKEFACTNLSLSEYIKQKLGPLMSRSAVSLPTKESTSKGKKSRNTTRKKKPVKG